MYYKLISQGYHEITAKIKVIEKIISENKITETKDWTTYSGERRFYGKDQVLEKLRELKTLRENIYKRLALANICNSEIYKIPFDLCEIINNHLTTILNE